MTKIVRSTLPYDEQVSGTGAFLNASGIDPVEIDQNNYDLWSRAVNDPDKTQLLDRVSAGDWIVSDYWGYDLDPFDAIKYLNGPIDAFGQRFWSDPERVNGFVSKTTQEAIEEARDGQIAQGRTFETEFFNNGNTANKWIFHIPTSEATDQLPYFAYWDLDIFGVSFGNKNSPVDCDVEFYVNGTTNPFKVYTLEVRGNRYQWETTLAALFSMNIGDGLSIFVKKVGQSTPASVEVDINVRIRTNTFGPGGSL